MIRDPVCNMQIDEAKDNQILAYNDQVYHFCSEGCKAEFQRHPEEYAEIDSADKERRERV